MRKHSVLNWIVLALCLLSFVRGIYALGERSLWWDESLSHYRATKPFSFILTNQIYLKSGWNDIRTIDNHPPLYFLLLRLVVLAAGDGEFAMRFPSLAAGVLLVPLLYQCGRRTFGPASGAWAAALGALSPLYLWAQQEARPYALGTLLATASFYSLLRVLQAPDRHAVPAPDRQGHRLQWAVLYGLFTAATIVTHYHSLLLLPAHGLTLLLAGSRHRRRLLWLLPILALLAGGALLWGLRNLPIQAEVPGYVFIPLGALLTDVLRSFPLGISGTELAWCQWVATGLLAAALIVLLARRRHTPWRRGAYLLMGFCLPVIEIYLLSFYRPAYMNIRHLIFASPFYYLLLAAGLAEARALRLRVPAALAAGTLMVGMLLSTQIYYTDPRYDREDHRAWGRYLSEHIRPDDFVLINPGPISELYFYYVDTTAPWYGFPPMYIPAEDIVSRLQQTMERHDRVWVAQSLTPHWANADNITIEWLDANAMRVAFADFYSASTIVQAHAFRLRPPLLEALPADLTAVGLDFGDRLHLLGVGSPMGRGLAGGVLQLSLYWSAAQPLGEQYRVTLTLVDEDGFAWASTDYAPCAGAYPTTEWPAGHTVRDDVDLRVPVGVPPGRYRLHVSVYAAGGSEPALAAYDLESGALQGLIVPAGELEVAAPARPPTEGEVPLRYPTRRRYGDLLLLGHDNDPVSLQPGDVMLLDAYWRAVRAPREGASFGLQLVDEEGKLWATRSISPGGRYPPSQWARGQVIRGQYRFRIPADLSEGRYSLQLVAEGGGCLSSLWSWAGRRITLAEVRVRPPSAAQSFEVPPMQHAMGVALGDRVELLGYDLATSTVRPGEVVSCTLYWRALQDINQNYTVFNHLVAPDGQTWGQWDNQPQRGNAPTTRWMPGQVIADPYQIPVSADAPPGPLELRVGMYDRLSMGRLPVRDEQGEPGGDYVVVTQVEVSKP